MNRRSPLQQEIPFEALDPERVRMESARKQALEQGRTRLLVTGVLLTLAFIVLGVRLVDLTRHGKSGAPTWRALSTAQADAPVVTRGQVRDRNGHILAASLPTNSLFVNSIELKEAGHVADAADQLLSVLPDLDRDQVIERMNSGSQFMWLARNLTQDQVWNVNRLGIPGLHFRKEEHRVYPHGSSFAHVLGYTNVDGKGIAGLERTFEGRLGNQGEDVELAVDVRVQMILREELMKAKERFDADGAAGVVMDVTTGEIIAMSSLPDFNPNTPAQSLDKDRVNRVTMGVYEMGSTFKLFNTAMALDTGTASLSDGYDATDPIRIARFTINDLHAKKRWLSVPEILVYSSNIGSAKMALDVGGEKQKEYLRRFGLLGTSDVELPEVGTPMYPARWGDISTMTISYGHGIAVSALQVAAGVSALVNGGVMNPPTLIKQTPSSLPRGTQVLKPETSKAMRALMRLVVRDGTGRNADVQGYLVGGKTGTAEKQAGGRYDKGALISSFVGAFPMTAPRFVVLAVVDEPKGRKDTFGYATGGWVAAPVVKAVIERLGPLYGIPAEVDGVEGEGEDNPDHPLYLPHNKGPKQTVMLDNKVIAALGGRGVRHASY